MIDLIVIFLLLCSLIFILFELNIVSGMIILCCIMIILISGSKVKSSKKIEPDIIITITNGISDTTYIYKLK